MLSVRVACAARIAWVACLALVLPASAAPASAERLLIPSASWHGRAIQEPHRHEVVRTAGADVPRRWAAGAVSFGTGYHRPGGSLRVREVQLRLRRLGYRPGPVDGLFGPRTRAAVAWFQVKHGLPVSGRATLATVGHLRTRTGAGFGRPRSAPSEQRIAPRPAPIPRPRAVPASVTPAGDSMPAWWLVGPALLVAAFATAILWPRRKPVAAPPHDPRSVEGAMLADVPAPAGPPRRRRRVLAYVLIPSAADDDASYRDHSDAIEAECAEQGLALAGLVSDREDARLDWQRPGLATAVERLVSGDVDYLMVTRLADPSQSGPQLQRLVKATENEIAIARWQHTPIGKEHAHG